MNILFLGMTKHKRDINFKDPTQTNFIYHNHQASRCTFINISTVFDVFDHKTKLLIYFT